MNFLKVFWYKDNDDRTGDNNTKFLETGKQMDESLLIVLKKAEF